MAARSSAHIDICCTIGPRGPKGIAPVKAARPSVDGRARSGLGASHGGAALRAAGQG